MKLHHLIMLVWLAGTWTAMPASGGYLVDSRGAVVRNSYGECWRTGTWTPAQAIAECDPDLVKKESPKGVSSTSLVSKAEPQYPVPKPSMEVPVPMAYAVESKAAAEAKGMMVYGKTASLVKRDTAAIHIHEHHWAPILQKGDEVKYFAGFGMYTYVLFGRDPGQEDPIRARYKAVLGAVLDKPELSNHSSEKTRGATNLFCLPAKRLLVSWQKSNLEPYDFPMAQDYLKDFRFLLTNDKDILQRLVRGDGIFLIATLQPLGSIVKTEGKQIKIAKSQAPILFVDLTYTHPQVIAEMVDAFKLEVINTTMDRRKRFRPLRVTLIDLLKKADDQVTPIREAVAGFMPKENK